MRRLSKVSGSSEPRTDVTDVDTAAPVPTTTTWRRRMPSWWVSGPIALYVFLVLLGVTQSSIGIVGMRENPAAPTGTMLGGPLAIRTDEYLTSTPLTIGVTASGSTENLNPLTAPQGFFTLLPTGPVSSVVLFDGAELRLGTFLPDQMLFAARWWLPFLLLFLGAPAFFRNLTGSRVIGLFAAVLIVVSPASAWWSFSPLGMLGFTIAGAAALQACARELAVERRRWRAAAWGLGAAVLLARTPLHYQPWAIVVAPTILLMVIVPLVADRAHRKLNLIAIGATGVTSLLLAGGVVLENLASIRASVGTLYPGGRVSTGGPSPFQEIFGATTLGWLRNAPIIGTNHSEISSSYAIAAVWVVLALAYGVTFRDRSHRLATLTAVGFVGFWFSWTMVDFGAWGARIPVLNLVPPSRVADIIGYLAVLLACLVLPALRDRPKFRFALLAAGVTALIAAYAGSLLRTQNLPGLAVRNIFLAAVLLAAVIFMLTYRPRWWGGYVAAGALGLLMVWNVNPVLFGLADLRGSAAAKQMLHDGSVARSSHTVWASDDLYVDSLLSATAVPSLSGRQLAGPDRDTWAKLDPIAADEKFWNRGGSFIAFEWTQADTVTISNPTPDAIHISGSPCTIASRLPQLTTIVSSHQLDLTCLTEKRTFGWGGNLRWVYDVTSTAAQR